METRKLFLSSIGTGMYLSHFNFNSTLLSLIELIFLKDIFTLNGIIIQNVSKRKCNSIKDDKVLLKLKVTHLDLYTNVSVLWFPPFRGAPPLAWPLRLSK